MDYNLTKLYEKVYKGGNESKTTITDTYKLVVERSKAEFKRDITAVDPRIKPGVDKRGAMRLQPTDKNFSVEDFKNALEKIDVTIEDVIPPGQNNSASGKFLTYKLKDKDGVTFFTVMGGGSFGNKGMSYERQLVDEIKNAINTATPHPLLSELEQLTGTKFINVKTGFNKLVKRKLSDRPENVGDEIADIVLVGNDGVEYFVSLKDKNGKTISNNGIVGIFKQQGDKIVPGFHQVVKKLFAAVKLDLPLAAAGLNAYKDNVEGGQQTPVDVTSYMSEADKNTVKGYLASAVDYGYLYVKNKGNNRFEIVDLATPEDVYNFIGDIQNVTIKYPCNGEVARRKHISIVVTTTTGRFAFDVRNASGELLPKQINLVRA